MRITRRKFIGIVSAATAALAVPFDVLGQITPGLLPTPIAPASVRIPTIAEIIAASWEPALHEVLGGRPWSDDRLNRMEAEGRITRMPLAASLEKWFTREDGSVYRRTYDIQQLNIPATWTDRDEQQLNTVNKRVSFVATLLENVIYSHDDMLADYVPEGGHLVVSKAFCRERGEVQRIAEYTDDEGATYPSAYFFRAYTACVIADKDWNQVDLPGNVS